MTAFDLEEFAERLRITGDSKEVEFAREILELWDSQETLELHGSLCDDLNYYVPDLKDKPAKQIEKLGDDCNLFDEIKEELTKANLTGDPADELRALLAQLQDTEEMLREHGGWTEGAFLDALYSLCERSAPMEYDL